MKLVSAQDCGIDYIIMYYQNNTLKQSKVFDVMSNIYEEDTEDIEYIIEGNADYYYVVYEHEVLYGWRP